MPEPGPLTGADEAIADARDRLHRLANVVDELTTRYTHRVAVIVVDRDLNIAHWSDGAEEFYGLTSDEMVGRFWPTEKDRNATEEELAETAAAWTKLLNGEPIEGIYSMPAKNGARVRAYAEVIPVMDGDELLFIVGVSYPIQQAVTKCQRVFGPGATMTVAAVYVAVTFLGLSLCSCCMNFHGGHVHVPLS